MKVLAIFLGFYLLQTQILQLRYDVHGSSTQIAHAHELTQSELGDTQQLLELTIEDSSVELAHAKTTLKDSIESLKREREETLKLIDSRTRSIEAEIRSRLEDEWEKVNVVKTVAEANAARLDRMSDSLLRESKHMKSAMLYPTLQLRGNGTVGSGVLIYSEEQAGLSESPVYTTFALTAYHVVIEILGGEHHLDREVEEIHVMVDADSNTSAVFSANVVLFDRERDIALLRLNAVRRFRNLAELMPPEGLRGLDVFSPAYAVGCPLGNRPLPTLGEISSMTKKVGDQVFWMLNAPTFFGNSGGGVYQASTCRLIGVSSMIYTYGKRNPTVVPHMGLFVPLTTIYDWLDSEGYSFVYQRQAIPQRLKWKLAYLGAAPRQAAAAPASSKSEPTSD